LVSFKGNYPYPTISSQIGDEFERVPDSKILREKGNVHFMHLVDEHEMIVISRPVRTLMVFFTSFSYLMLALTLLLLLFVRGRRSSNFRSNYFRTRINTILFVSSCLILVSMTIISVLFVYKRNEVNMYNLMSSKINTVQALVEDHVRHVYNWRELRNKEFFLEIEKLGNTTKSDISIYTPEGKVFHSTMPEVFEKMVLGSRMPEDAFYNIRYQHQRFYISREIVAGRTLWSLYAPIFNDSGDLIAIIAVPYTDKSFDFRREALFHAAMIINFFLLLLIGSLLFSTREVNSMFSPLLEMGRKMKSADINNLEYIVYKREDEISSLVDAYNRMVRDLSDSTRQLAQAERDNAWSQMARQVAHEIKNPLTPIKLELQRLIRLKQKGNPAWEEKFDKVSDVVLEHIDILTDTANEFSTFAKLYSEEPVLLDLDRILKDQLLIFDNKENIRISYLGMADAYVVAPKPQLIRVFVNLITNAIQAVEMHQREVEAEGGEPFVGKVTIYLRNSIKDGFYDVVVDDNGTGVKEENVGKLFTPNFTTKSAGTGLGLAICRNIMEKCGGEISYKRSYSLGGASFTVTIPKKNDEEC
jgi:signal transduction histidine kinase